jgi:hypothetical protein
LPRLLIPLRRSRGGFTAKTDGAHMRIVVRLHVVASSAGK